MIDPAFIQAMPKVELHVHLEGSIAPATLLELARHNNVALPVATLDELREWYRFRDFPHFAEIYGTLSRCLRTVDDLEFIARAFLAGQAEQNIRYSEVTYTAFTQFRNYGLPYHEQLAALNRARRWGEETLGVAMGLIIDIPRQAGEDAGMLTAGWVIDSLGDGVVALGLGGIEVGHPPRKHAAAFARARQAGVPLVLHAGETDGPHSIWDALAQGSQRIGHGVRCIEDRALVDELRDRQIPLEVCPTSNVCLGVAPSFAEHPLPELIDAGLSVTLNSDDPPMFNTTLTDEYLTAAETFELSRDQLTALVLNAARVSLLPDNRRAALEAELITAFAA